MDEFFVKFDEHNITFQMDDDGKHRLCAPGTIGEWSTYASLSTLSVDDKTYIGSTAFGLLGNAVECVAEISSMQINPNIALVDVDVYNDDHFASALKQGMKRHNKSDRDVANALGISTPSIARWKEGRNLPHVVMRKLVLKYFKELED